MLKKMLLGVGALVLGLTLTSEASAQNFRPGPGRGPIGGPIGGGIAPRPYYLNHGVRHGNGYFYRGKHHNHWRGRIWDARFNRFHYWDPFLRCYYYYCPRTSCYLPVSGFPGGGFPGGGFPGFPF